MATHENGVVCIVDDDASLRRSLRNLLSSVGFEVETFDSAEAFLGSKRLATPCCLVLDLRMPGMGGLELLSALTAISSLHPTIVLTGHGDDETRRRCLVAGAVAFLEKPFQSEMLLDAVARATTALAATPLSIGVPADTQRRSSSASGRMSVSDLPIQFAGGTLDRHCHICAFFSSAEEEHRVLRSFIKDGIDAGEKCFHIVDPAKREEHLQWLRDEGIDVEATISSGQLDVRTWADTYFRGDRFEQDAMLAQVEEALDSHPPSGFPRTRVLAHMEWALLDKPGVEDLVEYEARANNMLSRFHVPVICAYDLSKFSASVVMDVLRTHPMVIIGGVLQENPFFVPPEQFLLELRKARHVARTNATIAS